MVLDFDRLPPHYRVYQLQNPARLVVDLPACGFDQSAARGKDYKDSLVQGWRLVKENFRRARMEVALHYEVPPENIKVMLLKDESPQRLVIDVEKCFYRAGESAVTSDVRWKWVERATREGYALINELVLDPAKGNASLRLALANDNNTSREKTTAMRKRLDALAAVNGGFFSTKGGALGLVYNEGKVIAGPVSTRPPRTVLAVMENKKVLFEKLVVRDNTLLTLEGRPLRKVDFALGGGPRLIRDGTVDVTADEEGLGKSGNDITRRAGRTAFALDRRGHLHIYTVTGFSESHNAGMKLEELALYLKEHSMVQAMCVDGGNSSVMDIMGYDVSRGAGNRNPERPVGNGILLVDSSPRLLPYQFEEVRCSPESIPADGKSFAELSVKVKDGKGKTVPDGTVVRFRASRGVIAPWVSTRNGVAKNRLHSAGFPGKATVEIECGLGGPEPLFVEFLPGSLAEFHVKASPLKGTLKEKKPSGSDADGEAPLQASDSACTVEVITEDQYRNLLPGVEVQFDVLERDTLKASRKLMTEGKGSALVQLGGLQEGMTLKVTCGGLPPRTYRLSAEEIED
ncbi:MAG: phosphodiester glycosidase family protein [Candidatus Eremiobacteraeota bacterium]|nr:phosphodiester glycosidase family protein [Candidatus Eremiobacteraeota bacterium]